MHFLKNWSFWYTEQNDVLGLSLPSGASTHIRDFDYNKLAIMQNP